MMGSVGSMNVYGFSLKCALAPSAVLPFLKRILGSELEPDGLSTSMAAVGSSVVSSGTATSSVSSASSTWSPCVSLSSFGFLTSDFSRPSTVSALRLLSLTTG